MRGSRRHVGAIVLLTAAIAVVLTGFAYRRDLVSARQRLTASTVVVTPCGPIEYSTAGNGQPILVVHGAGGGFDQGLMLGAPLMEHGYRVIAPSRFGYLRTPLPADATAAAQADAHACLLEALDIPRVNVLGASAGAPSALQLAIRHPHRVSSLALLVPAAFVPRPAGDAPVRVPSGVATMFDIALRSDFFFWALLRAAPKLMTRSLLGTPNQVVAAASPGEQARVAGILSSILPVSPRRHGLLNDGTVTTHLTRFELERVLVPTLTISAADDLYGTCDVARYTAEQIPGARFVGYPSGGHVLVGRQEALNAELVAFLHD